MKKQKTVQFFHQCSGQATIEFTFTMVIVVLLLFGMIQVAVWSGMDLADRRKAHEDFLTTTSIRQGGVKKEIYGKEQTNPTFYYSSPIGAAVSSNIFKKEDREF